MAKKPADIRTRLFWYRTEFRTESEDGVRLEGVLNPEAHEVSCQVYWGSHGCERPNGHKGAHWCDCCDCKNHPESGCVAGPPYYGADTRFFGEGVGG